LLGAVPEQELLALVEAMAAAEPVAVVEASRGLLERGREPGAVLQGLAGLLRDLVLAGVAPDRLELTAVSPALRPQLPELARRLGKERLLQWQAQLQEQLQKAQEKAKEAAEASKKAQDSMASAFGKLRIKIEAKPKEARAEEAQADEDGHDTEGQAGPNEAAGEAAEAGHVDTEGAEDPEVEVLEAEATEQKKRLKEAQEKLAAKRRKVRDEQAEEAARQILEAATRIAEQAEQQAKEASRAEGQRL
jgi:DNA polymerase III gamma/tau subunit